MATNSSSLLVPSLSINRDTQSWFQLKSYKLLWTTGLLTGKSREVFSILFKVLSVLIPWVMWGYGGVGFVFFFFFLISTQNFPHPTSFRPWYPEQSIPWENLFLGFARAFYSTSTHLSWQGWKYKIQHSLHGCIDVGAPACLFLKQNMGHFLFFSFYFKLLNRAFC